MTADATHRAIEASSRIETSRRVAGLARIVRDSGLAQGALVAALEHTIMPRSATGRALARRSGQEQRCGGAPDRSRRAVLSGPRSGYSRSRMHSDQRPYRQLREAILDYDGSCVAEDLLRPWTRAHDEERRWFAALAAARVGSVPAMPVEDRWRLYAMSRVCDLLRLSCARRPGYDPRWDIDVPLAAYLEFMDAFGFQAVEEPRFHPFFHEVVIVEQSADDDAPVRLLAELWPAHGLGALLFARAGCRVAAGRRLLRKEIAEGSTLYWAHARNNRPTTDLSVGWGSNSQWRTGFRRDYTIDGELFYNVDAGQGPPDAEDDLTPEERLELLRHRCFVRCSKPHEDRFPYDQRHREPGP